MSLQNPASAGSVDADGLVEISTRARALLNLEFALRAIGSVFGSFAVLSLIAGPKLACLLVASFFFHELGHALAMHHYGYTVHSLTIGPIGGWTEDAGDSQKRLDHDLMISLCGPALGVVFALGLTVIAVKTANVSLLVSASFIGFYNLSDLLPLPFFDGWVFVRALQHFTKRA